MGRLDDILKKKPWEQRELLIEYCKELEKNVGAPKTRTGAQNRGLHLWCRQISDLCIENGIDASMVFSKTHDIQMTPEAVKTMFKALQLALFGTKSTRDLKKTGEIDTLIDHFMRFFGEKFELELPPFPHEEKNVKLKAMENVKREDYPEYHGEPTI